MSNELYNTIARVTDGIYEGTLFANKCKCHIYWFTWIVLPCYHFLNLFKNCNWWGCFPSSTLSNHNMLLITTPGLTLNISMLRMRNSRNWHNIFIKNNSGFNTWSLIKGSSISQYANLKQRIWFSHLTLIVKVKQLFGPLKKCLNSKVALGCHVLQSFASRTLLT